MSLTQKLGERGRFAKVSLVWLGLTGANAQVSVGWKEIYAVVERSPCIGNSNAFALNGCAHLDITWFSTYVHTTLRNFSINYVARC